MIREDGQVRLLVEDDGIGFLQRNVYRGRSFGLAGMRERVATLGGTVRVRSSKGRGTRIEVTMPDSVPAMPAAAETPYQSRALAMAGISSAS
jgi:glucose-6-phosphate-specific signal transduction histidine kinase